MLWRVQGALRSFVTTGRSSNGTKQGGHAQRLTTSNERARPESHRSQSKSTGGVDRKAVLDAARASCSVIPHMARS
jgi:hypothetical protein